jgi:putative nucleotidyltransferase with HDIG domain
LYKNNYLILIALAFLSIACFFLILYFTPQIPFAFDNLAARILYIVNGKTICKDLVIVPIDERSLAKINQRWPLPRSLYAQALNRLKEENAKVVGLDIVFMGPGENPANDAALEKALAQFGTNAVLGYFLDQNAAPQYPWHQFSEVTQAGFINAATDTDGVIRNLRAQLKTSTFHDFAWFVKVAASYYHATPTPAKHAIILGAKKISLNEEGMMRVNYFRNPQDIITVPFYDLLKGNFPKDTFKDKIVLIAATAKIVGDIHPTPLGTMPGVFIQANALADVLTDRTVMVLPFYVSLAILLATLVALTVIVNSFSFFRSIFLSLGVLLSVLWISITGKIVNVDFSCGTIIVAAFCFLGLLYIQAYLRSLALMLKIKNAMTKDPLTNLYNTRYFYEKLRLDLRSIPPRKRFLIAVMIKDFQAFSKGGDFDKLKDLWKQLYDALKETSDVWARYDEEVIVGVTKKITAISVLKKRIEAILHENNVTLPVRIGIYKMQPDIVARNVIGPLIKNLRERPPEVYTYTNDDIGPQVNEKTTSEDLLSSLVSDTEERNKELLLIIRQLKEEERKTDIAYLQLMTSLVAALESKDAYTEGHTQRVCKYAALLAQQLKLSDIEIEKIKKAALLHDLGKIGIPDQILHKKGTLTQEEFEVIKQHEITGVKIIEPIEKFKEITPYILHHHEHFDGTGYPQGLAGNAIPLGARIITVADVFDALTTGRDYKKALPVQKAIQEMEKNKGTQLDPGLVDVFIETLRQSHLI